MIFFSSGGVTEAFAAASLRLHGARRLPERRVEENGGLKSQAGSPTGILPIAA